MKSLTMRSGATIERKGEILLQGIQINRLRGGTSIACSLSKRGTSEHSRTTTSMVDCRIHCIAVMNLFSGHDSMQCDRIRSAVLLFDKQANAKRKDKKK
jgi:hypothetical protein